MDENLTVKLLEDLAFVYQNLIMDFQQFLKASFIDISDVINLQRKFRTVDLQNFFLLMEVWGQQIDIDLRKVKNVNSFISRQYSDDLSDDEVNDGTNSADEK